MKKDLYKKGRSDLIKEIKKELSNILQTTNNPNDLMFDIMNLLKNLK